MGLTKKVGAGNFLYLSIVGGNMVEKSDKDNPEAIKRTFKDDDGNVVVKYDIRHKDLTGHIVEMKFEDSKYGEQFFVVLQSGDEKAKLTMPSASNYFSDFAQRLPDVDLSKEVVLNAYDMEKDNGKRNKGINIKQDGETVSNAYWDGKKNLHGFPSVSKEDTKDYDSDDWKMHFIQVKKFLKKNVEKMNIPTYTPPTSEGVAPKKKKGAKVYTTEPITGGGDDDLPF